MEEVIGKIKEQAAKVKEGAVKLGRTAIDKTNNVVGQTKVKFAISETEDKIKEIYAKIGSEIYASHVEGVSYPDLSEQCEKLDELHKEADNLREQLSELKMNVKCPECGAYNSSDDAYCSKCGGKLTIDDITEEAEAVAEVIEETVEEVTEATD